MVFEEKSHHPCGQHTILVKNQGSCCFMGLVVLYNSHNEKLALASTKRRTYERLRTLLRRSIVVIVVCVLPAMPFFIVQQQKNTASATAKSETGAPNAHPKTSPTQEHRKISLLKSSAKRSSKTGVRKEKEIKVTSFQFE